MKKNIYLMLFLFFSAITLSQAAGISVGGTRFVYNEGAREISIPVRNTDKSQPFLIQSWVAPFEGNEKPPFIATPPLFRLEADSTSNARISYTGPQLGSNQEVVYWLNVKSIPPKQQTTQNQLQIVVNSQFKLFLRSKDIEPFDFDKVTISKQAQGLVLNNNTPYHLTIKYILVGEKRIPFEDLINPHQEITILKESNINQKVIVRFINDYGASIDKELS